MKRNHPVQLVFAAILSLSLLSCSKEKIKPVAPQFVFKHHINGYDFQVGAMNYTNQAGNVYSVDELQYFISDVSITTADGQILPIADDSAVHYVDMNVPSTLTWSPKDRLQVTDYSSITFTFGLSESKNQSGYFVNPPERDMFWPDAMGGGFHHMKMNGKWIAAGDTVKPFNMHLGRGMNAAGTETYPNSFTVTLPLNVHSGTLSNTFTITMDIEKWFASPNVWNWNMIGGQIMQNQDAMLKAVQNGANVFSVSHEGTDIIYHDL
jgi:hypothetical protein